jgi:hypothetical protein
MPLMRLRFQPGIVKDSTHYSADNQWYDGSLVRFRNGYPEMWRGWQKFDTTTNFATLGGKCRSLIRDYNLAGTVAYVGIGCSHRYYIQTDGSYTDVTPIAKTVNPLANNPISVTNGSSVATITDTGHGQIPGNYVIFSGATTTGGILNTTINLATGYAIVSITDANHYTVDFGTNATSTTSGGGAAVVAKYLLNAGSDDVVSGGGWGTLAWGEEEWGGDPSMSAGERMGIWSAQNWGEDIVANAQRAGIYYWDLTTPTTRMVNIRDLVGADGNAPTVCDFILVSHASRQLLAFGCTEFGGSTFNPMTVRWCSQETITDWDESSTTNTAGSIPFAVGSRLISAIATQDEILVWSDTALYSMRFIGAPYIYASNIIESNTDIVGLKAAALSGSTVFWMGRSGIYAYSGRVQQVPCPVWDYVYQRINWEQAAKVVCCTNKQYNEVLFFYPSSADGNTEIDSYIAFDMVQNIWSIGSLARTAWLDIDTLHDPLAASTDGYLYAHDVGYNDGSTTPDSALTAYIQSGPIELSSEGAYDKGDRFAFIRRILPDVTFRSATGSPEMNIVLKMLDKPGSGSFNDTSSRQVVRSATLPVEAFTDELHVRLRGRSIILRCESTVTGTQWRLGTPRIDVRPDGQR